MLGRRRTLIDGVLGLIKSSFAIVEAGRGEEEDHTALVAEKEEVAHAGVPNKAREQPERLE